MASLLKDRRATIAFLDTVNVNNRIAHTQEI